MSPARTTYRRRRHLPRAVPEPTEPKAPLTKVVGRWIGELIVGLVVIFIIVAVIAIGLSAR